MRTLTTLFLLTFALFLAGQSKKSHLLTSGFLDEERHVSIQLPRTYAYSNRAYPVLFVLDSEWAFSYAGGAADFLANEVMGYIPELIVVGISNVDRLRDMWIRQGTSDHLKFMDFIEKELIPMVDSTYRTNNFRIIYGWSSGGAISTRFFLTRPGVFDGYIESGSGVGPNTYKLGQQTLPLNDYANTYFYANCEGTGRRVKYLERYRFLLDSIRPKGLTYQVKLAEGKEHLDVLSYGIYDGLAFVFKDFRIPAKALEAGADAIISHYQMINSRFDFEVMMPEGAYVEAASLLSQDGRVDEAVKILEHGLETHPFSSDIAGTLGEIYFFEKDLVNAKQAYRQALELAQDQDEMRRLKYDGMLKGLE